MFNLGFASPSFTTVSTLGLGGDPFALAGRKIGAAISRNLQETGTPIRAGFSEWVARRLGTPFDNGGVPIPQGAQPVNLLSAAGGFNDPVFTSGGGGWSTGGTDWGGIINAIGGATFGYLNAKNQTKQLKQLAKLRLNVPTIGTPLQNPLAGVGGLGFSSGGLGAGGAAVLGGLGGLATGLGLPSLGGLTDMLPGGLEEGGTGLFGPDLFRAVSAGARQRMIDAPHPTTGERVYWRPVGKPILFSGDVSLLKRVRKVSRKLNAGCGVARATFRRRRRR